jgi:CheY-like chemotaxis protein
MVGFQSLPTPLKPHQTTFALRDYHSPGKRSFMLISDKQPSETPTILVVDDFDDTRLLLRTWLERKGYRVIEAHDGKQAIDAAKQSFPDLIIMDVQMPELDGLEATRQIRAVEELQKIPVLAVSAYGVDQFRAEALAAGCNEYVSTPFEPVVLERLIRSLITH